MINPLNTRSPTMGTPDCCGTFSCWPHFVAGVVCLALVEFLLVLYLLDRLVKYTLSLTVSPVLDTKIKTEDNSINLQSFARFAFHSDDRSALVDRRRYDSMSSRNAWVAPLPDVDLSNVIIKQTRKDKKKEKDVQKDCGRRGEGTKEAVEIAPMWRRAFLLNETLFLRSADGAEEKISLEGCEVLTVSSGPGANRKWGKKYPIKLHHPDRRLYGGCKTFIFYSESGYAKEAWCEAFRAMARAGSPFSEWIFKMKRNYREYTRVAQVNMPYLTKFFAADEARHMDVKQKDDEAEGHSKRGVWKKLARRVSMRRDHKEAFFTAAVEEMQRKTEARSQGQDDKRWNNKEIAFYDKDHRGTNVSASQVVDPNFVGVDCSTSNETLANGEAGMSVGEGNNPAPASSQMENRESRNQVPGTQQKAQKAKDGRTGKEIEQGVLCLNMIVARLYFDFNQSERRLASVERFFQRLILKIRTPSYIKSITIKKLDLGKHPPFATGVRVLPSDAEGALSMELDLEWHGGGYLTCETRLDLREQSTQEKVAAQLTVSGSEGDAAAAVLSGIRGDFDVQEGRQANLPSSSGTGDEGIKKGRWMQSVKSMMSRVADQVSQVPLVLKIRLASLKGTVVLRLKAPPSDRVWFAFKEMPDIHLEPEPCIGELRISSDALGKFIANQIKVQIKESVVTPYCEDFFLNWMVADKDNWLPQSTFPFPFFESQSSEAERESSKQSSETQSSSSDESGRPGHQPLPRTESILNGQNKPPKGQASHSHPKSALPRPSKSQKPAHLSHANGASHEGASMRTAQPSTSGQDRLQPRRSNSEQLISLFSALKPPRSASSDHLNSQFSVPKPPKPARAHLSDLITAPVQVSGSAALSLASPLISKETRPLLKNEESHEEEAWESAGDSDQTTSSVAMDARSKDYASHSEGSASETDLQFLANQVANPEDVRELDQSSKLTRRARAYSLGRKVLDEGRRNVAEKLHHKRPDDPDGVARSQRSGRWAYEAPHA